MNLDKVLEGVIANAMRPAEEKAIIASASETITANAEVVKADVVERKLSTIAKLEAAIEASKNTDAKSAYKKLLDKLVG
jgi:hypothetical protein